MVLIEVVNGAENDKEDLLQDLVSSIYSMCARLYGQQRAKLKRDLAVDALKQQECATGMRSLRLQNVQSFNVCRFDGLSIGSA